MDNGSCNYLENWNQRFHFNKETLRKLHFLMVNRSMQIVDDLEIFSHVSMIADEDSGRLLSYVLLASQSVQLSIMSLTMTRPDERIFADHFCSNVSHRLVRKRADRTEHDIVT